MKTDKEKYLKKLQKEEIGNEVKVPVELVKEAYEAACTNWKTKIDEAVPNLFTMTLPKGKWMINEDHYDCFVFVCENAKDNEKTLGIHVDNAYSAPQEITYVYDYNGRGFLDNRFKLREPTIEEYQGLITAVMLYTDASEK